MQYIQCCLSDLSSGIWVGSPLQQLLCHIHLSILGGHMQWSEAFLQKHQKGSDGNVKSGCTTLNETTENPYNGVINGKQGGLTLVILAC